MTRDAQKSHSCRACGGRLSWKDSIHYGNMPKGAQNFPTRARLASDCGIDLDLVECSACGVMQLSTPPVSYWRNVIRAVGFSEEMLAFRRAQLNGFVQRHNLRGRRGIEFGCGDGAYLSLLADTGLHAMGLEYAARSVRSCISRGLAVRRGFAEKNMLMEEGPFDAFFIFSYLEHIPHLRDFLATVRGNLKDGAIGLVEVPNFDMILRKNVFAELIIDHLFYFTAETLCRTLENNGFRVLSCTSAWHDYILSAEIARRSPEDISGLARAQADATAGFMRFLKKHRRAAVWGASHQAFTMLALLPDVSKIAYITDSAPFKQGRFSPVTHIPVLTPETLRTNPVDALIVMGGSYSDEIAHIASLRYGQRNVAVFHNNRLECYAVEEMP